MNVSKAKGYIDLLQAIVGGKTIQIDRGPEDGPEAWRDCDELDFSYNPSVYRIKPDPRERWAVYYASGTFFTTVPTRVEAEEISTCERLLGSTIALLREVQS